MFSVVVDTGVLHGEGSKRLAPQRNTTKKQKKQIGHHARPRWASATAPLRKGADTKDRRHLQPTHTTVNRHNSQTKLQALQVCNHAYTADTGTGWSSCSSAAYGNPVKMGRSIYTCCTGLIACAAFARCTSTACMLERALCCICTCVRLGHTVLAPTHACAKTHRQPPTPAQPCGLHACRISRCPPGSGVMSDLFLLIFFIQGVLARSQPQ